MKNRYGGCSLTSELEDKRSEVAEDWKDNWKGEGLNNAEKPA